MEYITRTEVKIDFTENELQTLSEAQTIFDELDTMVKETKVSRLTFDNTDYSPEDIYTAFSLICDILTDYNY